jgi:tetratricopeptide (TPR) repeat protein
MIKKADLLLATRKYTEALALLNTAALYDHQDMNLFILKTDAYLALDQPEEAIVLLKEALHLFEGAERTELLFELADVYDDHEAFDKVFDCLQLILEEEPTNEEALYKICFWTDFTGRNEESIVLHQKMIDEQPYNALAWFNLAAAYQGIKLYEKAIDAYQFAIVIDEKFDYAYRNMGDAYLRTRKYKEAIEALSKDTSYPDHEKVAAEAQKTAYGRRKEQKPKLDMNVKILPEGSEIPETLLASHAFEAQCRTVENECLLIKTDIITANNSPEYLLLKKNQTRAQIFMKN